MTRTYIRRVTNHQLGVTQFGRELPRLFGRYSWRNQKLAADHPTVNDGNQYARKIARQARYSTVSTPQALYGAGYQSTLGVGAPIFVSKPTDPRGRVRVVINIQDGGVGGTEVDDTFANGLPTQFLNVPFPSGIDNAASFGTDHSVTIYDAQNDVLYEFWRFFKSTQYPPYAAHYGGRILDASQADPVFPNGWGASATSISLATGMIRAQELIDGGIRHVLSCALPVIAAGHLPPATRDDGFTYGSSFIAGGESDYTHSTQPQLTTLLDPVAAGSTTVTLAAAPAGPGPGLYDFGVGTSAAEVRVTVTNFSGTTPCTAQLAAPLQKDHAAGEKFSISPLYDAVPEGAMFRFPASMTINSGWSSLTQMMAAAIRDYGLIVTDKGGVLGFGYEVGVGVPYNPLASYGNGGAAIAQLPWESIVQIEPPTGA